MPEKAVASEKAGCKCEGGDEELLRDEIPERR